MKQTVTKLKKKLDAIFSKYIRLKQADHRGYVTCVTCGKDDHYKNMQCGHFVSRGKLATRYDETNCNVQCVGCNMFKAGEQYKHGRYIDLVHGQGTADKLMAKGNEICQMRTYDYEALITKYTMLVKELEKGQR